MQSLEVYKLAKELAVYVYKITRDFPKEEKFGLTSQIRRCVSSVGANIAEGYGRHHFNDEVRFDYIARGSLFELQFHLELVEEFDYISNDDFDKITKRVKNLGVKLNNYITYLKKRSSSNR